MAGAGRAEVAVGRAGAAAGGAAVVAVLLGILFVQFRPALVTVSVVAVAWWLASRSGGGVVSSVMGPRSSRAAVAPRASRTAVLLWAAIVAGCVVTLAWSDAARALGPDPRAVRDGAQWWRVLTSAFVTGDGLVGSIVVLAVLAAALVSCAAVWGVGRAVVVVVAAQVLYGAFCSLVAPDPRGGVWGLTLAVGASVLGCALVGDGLARRVALVATVAAIGLSVAAPHGGAVVVGVLVGVVVAVVWPPPRSFEGVARRAA